MPLVQVLQLVRDVDVPGLQANVPAVADRAVANCNLNVPATSLAAVGGERVGVVGGPGRDGYRAAVASI